MDENTVILRAREFVRKANINEIPADIDKYLKAANAILKIRYDLSDSEAGQSFSLNGNNIICVNGNHIKERQRFTILHEVAHIILGLPSIHGDKLDINGLGSYESRPQEEIFCDVFAAECLLPYLFFKADVAQSDFGLRSIGELRQKYKASLTSTASRYAALSDDACAMILSENGVIRYVASSLKARELGFWVDIGIPVPAKSVIKELLASGKTNGDAELPVYAWVNNDRLSGCSILEESCVLSQWKQGVSILWLDDYLAEYSTDNKSVSDHEDELLPELDGVLPWPSKSKRRP